MALKNIKNKCLKQILSKVATVALFSAAASLASAQDASSKLDAWLMENALGPHATGQENWEGIVAAAKV